MNKIKKLFAFSLMLLAAWTAQAAEVSTCAQLRTALEGSDEVIWLTKDFDWNIVGGDIEIRRSVKICGKGGVRKIARGSDSHKYLFDLAGNITVTLENVTVDAERHENCDSLLKVKEGAALVLGTGATVTGYKGNGDSSGHGAVNVKAGSSLTMLAGSKITNSSNTRALSTGEAAEPYGGAVYVEGAGATFTMNGGEISECWANSGGAVYVIDNGTMNLFGGTITGCYAKNHSTSRAANGGAIYVAVGTLNVKGAPEVTGNTIGNFNALGKLTSSETCNIQLYNDLSDARLNQVGPITGGTIGVKNPTATALNAEGKQFGYAETVASGADHFVWDGKSTFKGCRVEGKLVWMETENPVCQIGDRTFSTLAKAFAAAASDYPGTDDVQIELLTDAQLTDPFTIDRKITLTSAAGESYTLTRSGDAGFTVTSGLTLGNLTLDGGTATQQKPLVKVENGGTLTIQDGTTIQNCKSTTAGGAVQAAGTVNLAGGTITGCSALQGGGAISLASTGHLNVSGAPTVADNTRESSLNNIQTVSDNQITLTGPFTGNVGLTSPVDKVSAPDTVDGDLFGTAADGASGAEHFFYDAKPELTGQIEGGTVLAWEPLHKVCRIGDVYYTSFERACQSAKEGDTIVLLDDVTLAQDVSLDHAVTVESDAGHTYQITRTDAAAEITVANGGALTLKNVTVDGGASAASPIVGESAMIVVAEGGALTLAENATMQNCKSAANGGAINNAGTVTLQDNATIKSSTSAAGALYTSGTVKVSGAPQVKDNPDGNLVAVGSGTPVTLTGPFTGKIGVTAPTTVGSTSPFGTVDGYTATQTDARNFICEGTGSTGYRAMVKTDGNLYWSNEGVYVPTEYPTFEAVWADETLNGENPLKIFIDPGAADAEHPVGALVVPAGRNVILDLAGNPLVADVTVQNGGSLTIVDSSDAKTGRLTGKVTQEQGGTLVIDAGNYDSNTDSAFDIKDSMLAADRMILENDEEPLYSVVPAVEPSEQTNVALDTRRGVRLVDNPAIDLLSFTYSSGNWVYGASDDESKQSTVSVAQAVEPTGTVTWHAGMTDAVAAPGDKSFNYATAIATVADGATWTQVYQGPNEDETTWLGPATGLVEAKHVAGAQTQRAWFKFIEHDTDIAAVIKDKVAEGANPGYTVGNDLNGATPSVSVNPWVVVDSPIAQEAGATDADPVAGTPNVTDPANTETKISLDVTGPGELTWKDLIQDPSMQNDATITVSIDGGDPVTLHTGNMTQWADEKVVFGGATDTAHNVVITFKGNSSGDLDNQAHGYVDDVTWTPYDTDVSDDIVDDVVNPSQPGYTVTNDSSDPWIAVKDPYTADGDAATQPNDPSDADDKVAQTPDTLGKGENTSLTFGVTGDGEFRFSSLVKDGDATADAKPAKVEVFVDGVLVQTYGPEDAWTDHVVHVSDAAGADGAAHTVEIRFTNDETDGDSSMAVDNVKWTPSATAAQLDTLEGASGVTVVNGVESGWMPVLDGEGNVVGLRAPNGTTGTADTATLDSSVTYKATGSGELALGTISYPTGTANTDNGALKITIDGGEAMTLAAAKEAGLVNYTETTAADGTVTVSNLTVPLEGPANYEHTVTLDYDRQASSLDGNTTATVGGTPTWTATTFDTNIADDVNDDPTKQPPEGYTGNPNDPADPQNPGFVVGNDPTNPWVAVNDPTASGATPADKVAATPNMADPANSETKIVLDVTGPGELTWKDLIADNPASGTPAKIYVVVDGGDRIELASGNTADWQDEKVVFGGDADTPHRVEIVFHGAGTALDQAHGYVDDVVWTPYETTDLSAVVTGSSLTVTNTGSDPTAEHRGVTLVNGTAYATTTTIDAGTGHATAATVNQAGAVTETSTGTRDSWYVIADPREGAADGSKVATTPATLSPNETTTFTVSGDGVKGYQRLDFDAKIDGAAADPNAKLVVTVKTTEGGVTTTKTQTFTAAELADWSEKSVTLPGGADATHEVSFAFTNGANGTATCSVGGVSKSTVNTEIGPAIDATPAGTAAADTPAITNGGSSSDPSASKWEVGKDPTNPGTPGDAEHPGEDVAVTPADLGPGESVKVEVAVKGAGELSWRSLVDDDWVKTEGGENACLRVTIDGGDPVVIPASELQNWTNEKIVFAEGDDVEHTVVIEFVNNSSTDAANTAKGYLDDVQWTPRKTTDLKPGLVEGAAGSTDYAVENLGSDRTQDATGVTLFVTGNTTTRLDTKTATVDGTTTMAVNDADTTKPNGTADYWYSTTDLPAGVPTTAGEVARTSETLSPGETSSFKATGLTGPGVLTFNGILNDGAATAGETGATLAVTVVAKDADGNTLETKTVTYTKADLETWGEHGLPLAGPDGTATYDVTFAYTANSDGDGFAAVNALGVVTKTADGGSSWLGVAPVIVDHEDAGDGYVYLAFKPNLKDAADLSAWLAHTDKIRVKSAASHAAVADATATAATLRTDVTHTAEKVWVKVALGDQSGYWRIYIEASKLDETVVTPGVASVNVFGAAKMTSTTKETMIPVPWTRYSAAETDAAALPVEKLVKPENLSDGDLLYLGVQGGKVYAGWGLENGVWSPLKTVNVQNIGSVNIVSAEAGTTLPRGAALWLVRHAQTLPSTFWLYGQSVTAAATTTIAAPTGTATVWSTMLANPYRQPVRLNALVPAEGTIGAKDTIWFCAADGTVCSLTYRTLKNGTKAWRMATLQVVNGNLTTVYNYDVTIPAGVGFWYDRREKTPLTIQWTPAN